LRRLKSGSRLSFRNFDSVKGKIRISEQGSFITAHTNRLNCKSLENLSYPPKIDRRPECDSAVAARPRYPIVTAALAVPNVGILSLAMGLSFRVNV
jgi:hypothetical protein